MYIEKQLWNSLNGLILIMDKFDEEMYNYAVSDIEDDKDTDILLCICKESDNTYTHRIPLCKSSGVNSKAIGMLYDNSSVDENGTVTFNLPYLVYDKGNYGDYKKWPSAQMITSHLCNLEGVLYYMYKTISTECEGNTYTTRSIIVDKKFNNVMLYVDVCIHDTNKNQMVNLRPIKSYAIKYAGDVDKFLRISSLKELSKFIASVNNNGTLYSFY